MARLTTQALMAPGGLLDSGSRLVQTLMNVPLQRARMEEQRELADRQFQTQQEQFERQQGFREDQATLSNLLATSQDLNQQIRTRADSIRAQQAALKSLRDNLAPGRDPGELTDIDKEVIRLAKDFLAGNFEQIGASPAKMRELFTNTLDTVRPAVEERFGVPVAADNATLLAALAQGAGTLTSDPATDEQIQRLQRAQGQVRQKILALQGIDGELNARALAGEDPTGVFDARELSPAPLRSEQPVRPLPEDPTAAGEQTPQLGTNPFRQPRETARSTAFDPDPVEKIRARAAAVQRIAEDPEQLRSAVAGILRGGGSGTMGVPAAQREQGGGATTAEAQAPTAVALTLIARGVPAAEALQLANEIVTPEVTQFVRDPNAGTQQLQRIQPRHAFDLFGEIGGALQKPSLPSEDELLQRRVEAFNNLVQERLEAVRAN